MKYLRFIIKELNKKADRGIDSKKLTVPFVFFWGYLLKKHEIDCILKIL